MKDIKIEIRNKTDVELEELTYTEKTSTQLSFDFEVEMIEKEETMQLKPEIIIQLPTNVKNSKDLLTYCWDVKSGVYRILKQYYGL